MDSREGWGFERREGEGTRTRMSIQNQIQWVEIGSRNLYLEYI